jgi:hypothetical protein
VRTLDGNVGNPGKCAPNKVELAAEHQAADAGVFEQRAEQIIWNVCDDGMHSQQGVVSYMLLQHCCKHCHIVAMQAVQHDDKWRRALRCHCGYARCKHSSARVNAGWRCVHGT